MIAQYLFYYLRDTFTTKKTKDLVEIQTKKYKSIVEELVSARSEVPFFREDDIPDGFSDVETIVDYDAISENLQKYAANLDL